VFEEVAVVCLFLALGGILKGATGMGTPVIAVPALAAYFDVPFAIAILIVPNIATNGWQIFRHRAEGRNLPFLKRFVVAGAIGALIGTLLLIELPANVLSLWLAAIVVLYIGLRLIHPQWRVRPRLALGASVPVGLISGVLQGATGISAPVSVTFLSAMQLPRPQFILSVSGLFIGFVTVQAPTLAISGILTWDRLALSMLAVLPVAAAMPAGAWLARTLSPRTFDRMVLTFLAGLAAKLFYDAGLFG
jgi:uncharacterized membrane protein YfcA